MAPNVLRSLLTICDFFAIFGQVFLLQIFQRFFKFLLKWRKFVCAYTQLRRSPLSHFAGFL